MYRIGIDLGGTNIAVGVVDERHHILAEISVPTDATRPYVDVIADMISAVEQVLSAAKLTAADCASIGIGSPGNCDSDRGVVVRAYNLGWFNVPICEMLQRHFGIPVRISNDANVAALAETVAGAALDCRNMVLITLGTGVGGGIIIDGKIYAGMRTAGAEMGHSLLVLDGEPCSCGRKGCWEAYASVTALIRQGKQAAAKNPESLLADIKDMMGLDIFYCADRGDAVAQQVIDRWCDYVAAGLTDIVNTLAPEKILIGGGVSKQGERILQPIRRYVADHCFGQHEGAIPEIQSAMLGNDAGIIGAAAL